MNRINIRLIYENIINKRHKNLDSYYVNKNTSPYNNKFSATPHNNISFNTSARDTEPIFPNISQAPLKTIERSTSNNPILDFTIAFEFPDGQSSNIDSIYEKIRLKVLQTAFYKIFVKMLVKYLTWNLST